MSEDWIDEIPLAHSFMCLKIEHESDSNIPDDCSCGAESKLTHRMNQEIKRAIIQELVELDTHLWRNSKFWNDQEEGLTGDLMEYVNNRISELEATDSPSSPELPSEHRTVRELAKEQ